MSENRTMLTETADRLFGDLAATPEDFAGIWTPIAENGFPSLLVGEDLGGFGGDWLDVFAVLRLAGYHALPAPLAEAMVAARLSADCGWAAGAGLVTIAASATGAFADGRFSGSLKSVGWGRHAESVIARIGGRLIRLSLADAAVTPGESPAGDPRDTLRFDGAVCEDAACAVDLFALGALTRTALIAGALDAALARSIDYANQRVQFGKPIGRFQAVQQGLAVFAEEAAAVNCAAQAAALAADRGDAAFEIAAAKIRGNMAAGIGGATAHQVHGAIGFTHEYQLHRWTRRLIAWAAEFGSERHWAEFLGGAVAARGPEALWRDITRRSDQAEGADDAQSIA